MPECQNCGRFVSPDFARVFGDNENRIEGCVDCETGRRLKSGGALPGER